MRFFIIIFFLLAISACETNQPRRVVQQLNYDLRIADPTKKEVFIEDIGISLTPISLQRAKTMENLYLSYLVYNPKNTRNRAMERGIMINLPAFEVQVTNLSKQSINFQRVAMRMVDDAGNTYEPQLKQDIIDFADQKIENSLSRGWALDRQAAMRPAKSLKLFDKNYEGFPNIVEKRILTFDTANAMNENSYRQMMKGSKYMKVMLYNVPVKFDQAGSVSKVANFEYVFDVIKK